jgi:hypothetical protein
VFSFRVAPQLSAIRKMGRIGNENSACKTSFGTLLSAPVYSNIGTGLHISDALFLLVYAKP